VTTVPFPTDGVEVTQVLAIADLERSVQFYRDVVSHELTLGVPDCRAAFDTLVTRGAQFLTPPVEHDWEIRAFFRDPDRHLLEISQAK
jgi:catechol 2,3-dioxygenase-like lactoylglutathione lyase family enzyme